jgi:hypothetical protein
MINLFNLPMLGLGRRMQHRQRKSQQKQTFSRWMFKEMDEIERSFFFFLRVNALCLGQVLFLFIVCR